MAVFCGLFPQGESPQKENFNTWTTSCGGCGLSAPLAHVTDGCFPEKKRKKKHPVFEACFLSAAWTVIKTTTATFACVALQTSRNEAAETHHSTGQSSHLLTRIAHRKWPLTPHLLRRAPRGAVILLCAFYSVSPPADFKPAHPRGLHTWILKTSAERVDF